MAYNQSLAAVIHRILISGGGSLMDEFNSSVEDRLHFHQQRIRFTVTIQSVILIYVGLNEHTSPRISNTLRLI